MSRQAKEANIKNQRQYVTQEAYSHTSSSVEERTTTERRHGSTDARVARVRWPLARVRTGAVCTLFSIATAIVESTERVLVARRSA